MPPQTQQRPVVIPEIVVVVLPEGKYLDALLGFDIAGFEADDVEHDLPNLESPFRVVGEPNRLGPVNEQIQPLTQQGYILVVGHLVLVGRIAEIDVVRWVGKDRRPRGNPIFEIT